MNAAHTLRLLLAKQALPTTSNEVDSIDIELWNDLKIQSKTRVVKIVVV